MVCIISKCNIFLCQGKIETQGDYDTVMKSGVDISTIMTESDCNSTEESNVFDEKVTSTSSENKQNNDMKIKQVKEESVLLKELESSSKGMVKGSLLLNYFKYANQPFTLIFLFASFLLAQTLASLADVWVSFWYIFLCILLFNLLYD